MMGNDIQGAIVRRHFFGEATRGQRVFDAIVGIGLPLMCVYLDPIVFTRHAIGDSSDDRGILNEYQAVAYLEIGLQAAVLGAWSLFPRQLRAAGGIIAGCFFTGVVFSLWVGCVIFPLSAMGLMALIGALGFAPFLTAFIYFRNSGRALLAASGRWPMEVLLTWAGFGAVLALAVPFLLERPVYQWILAAERRVGRDSFESLPLPAPVAFLQEDGRTLLAAGSATGDIRIWDVEGKHLIRAIQADPPVR